MSVTRTRPQPRQSPVSESKTMHEGEVLGCAVAARAALGVSVGSDGMLLVWEGRPGQITRSWRASGKAVLACAISPDGSRVLTGSLDGLLAQWDLATQRRISVFLAHPRPISAITYSPDGKRLATSSWDGTIMVWRASGEGKAATLSGHKDIVAGCRFTADGKRIFSWSYDGGLKLWDLQWYRPALSWQGHSDRVLAGDVSPDGRWLASAGKDGNVILWDAVRGQEIGRHSDPNAEYRACLFSPDAERLYTVSANGEILTHTVPEFQGGVCEETGRSIQCAALTRSGEDLVLGTTEGEVLAFRLPGTTERSCCATPYETQENRPSFIARLLKIEQMARVLHVICPICGTDLRLEDGVTKTSCPRCRRGIKANSFSFPERPEALALVTTSPSTVIQRPTFYPTPTPPPED